MQFHPQQFYHVFNRTNNREILFKTSDNYLFFLKKMNSICHKDASILAYCLMPTHFHWLIYTHSHYDDSITKLNRVIGTILGSYTQAYNRQFHRTGSLFQVRTKSKVIQTTRSNNYAINCFHYIHQNPLKANLVDSIEKWTFSSYPDYAEMRNGKLPDLERGRSFFGIENSEDFVNKSKISIDEKLISKFY